jgi:hypothetical protein
LLERRSSEWEVWVSNPVISFLGTIAMNAGNVTSGLCIDKLGSSSDGRDDTGSEEELEGRQVVILFIGRMGFREEAFGVD